MRVKVHSPWVLHLFSASHAHMTTDNGRITWEKVRLLFYMTCQHEIKGMYEVLLRDCLQGIFTMLQVLTRENFLLERKDFSLTRPCTCYGWLKMHLMNFTGKWFRMLALNNFGFRDKFFFNFIKSPQKFMKAENFK